MRHVRLLGVHDSELRGVHVCDKAKKLALIFFLNRKQYSIESLCL
jgi:hypothetical protein